MRSGHALNLAAIIMSLGLGPAWAQTPASAPAGTPEIPKGALGPEFADGSFGFAVRPLAGARIDRRKRKVEGRVQLLQFVRLEVGWSMSVRLWETARPLDVAAAKTTLLTDLLPQYPDVEIPRSELVQVAGRDAVRLTATFSSEGQGWLRQQAIIPLQNGEYVMVLLATPADDRELAETAFAGILDSFKVVRTRVQQEQLDAAVERGAALLKQVYSSQTPIAGRAMTSPTYLRVTRGGKGIGFIEILEKAGTLEHKDGLQILQRGWLFNPDESVTFFEESKFVSNDGTRDQWRNVVQVMPPKDIDPKQQVVTSIEGGVRQIDQLAISYIEHVGVSDKQDKLIKVTPSFGSPAWPLLLPRVVDLSKPEVYAFSMYDTSRQGLILRVFRVVGPTQVDVGGRRVSAVKLEDSEGLMPPINEVDVDASGQPVRLVSDQLEMIASTQADMEREFGSRIKATQELFRKNAGLPPLGESNKGNDNKGAAGAKAPAKPAKPHRNYFKTPSRSRSRGADK